MSAPKNVTHEMDKINTHQTIASINLIAYERYLTIDESDSREESVEMMGWMMGVQLAATIGKANLV